MKTASQLVAQSTEWRSSEILLEAEDDAANIDTYARSFLEIRESLDTQGIGREWLEQFLTEDAAFLEDERVQYDLRDLIAHYLAARIENHFLGYANEVWHLNRGATRR